MSPWAWLGDERATAERRAALRRLLGPLPILDGPPVGELLETQTAPHARIERWRLALNREEAVPALLLLPTDREPRALVLYCHAHGNDFAIGKDELLQGRPALQSPPYGVTLPALGTAVLAIDQLRRACASRRACGRQAPAVGRPHALGLPRAR